MQFDGLGACCQWATPAIESMCCVGFFRLIYEIHRSPLKGNSSRGEGSFRAEFCAVALVMTRFRSQNRRAPAGSSRGNKHQGGYVLLGGGSGLGVGVARGALRQEAAGAAPTLTRDLPLFSN